jgi:hypothetical protein
MTFAGPGIMFPNSTRSMIDLAGNKYVSRLASNPLHR